MSENLQVIRTTWHYRLIDYVYKGQWDHKRHPTNLCPYMRKIVMAIILLPGMAVWHNLPDRLTDHPDVAKSLVILAIMVHTIMFILTVTSGGELILKDTEYIITQYPCLAQYDLQSCVDVVTTVKSEISFTADGTVLNVKTSEVERTVLTIKWWWGWAVYFGIIAAIIIIVLFSAGVVALYDKIRDRPYKPHKKSETRELVSAYFTAKHNKICPCIDFKDSEKAE